MVEGQGTVAAKRICYVWIAVDVVVIVIHSCILLFEILREPVLLGDSRRVRHAECFELGVGAEIVVVIAHVINECVLDDDAGNAKSTGLADDAVVILRGASVVMSVIDVAGVVVARLDTSVSETKRLELGDNFIGKVHANRVGLVVVPMVVGNVDLGAIGGAGTRRVEVDAHENARAGVCGALCALLEGGVLVLATRHHDRCHILVNKLFAAVVGNLPREISLTSTIHADGARVSPAMARVERNDELGGAGPRAGHRALLGGGDGEGHALLLHEVAVLVDGVGGHRVVTLLLREGEGGDAVGDVEGAHLGVGKVNDVLAGVRHDHHAPHLERATAELRGVKGEERRHGVEGRGVNGHDVLPRIVLDCERRRGDRCAERLVEGHDDALRLACLDLRHVDVQEREDVRGRDRAGVSGTLLLELRLLVVEGPLHRSFILLVCKRGVRRHDRRRERKQGDEKGREDGHDYLFSVRQNVSPHKLHRTRPSSDSSWSRV